MKGGLISKFIQHLITIGRLRILFLFERIGQTRCFPSGFLTGYSGVNFYPIEQAITWRLLGFLYCRLSVSYILTQSISLIELACNVAVYIQL